MNGAWWFVAGWCSASAAIVLCCWSSSRGVCHVEADTTTLFAAEQGWPETQA